MKTMLMTVGLVLVGLSSGCLVRETVSDNGEVVSDRYKLEEPLHSRTTPY